VVYPAAKVDGRQLMAFLRIKLPAKDINTGYGARLMQGQRAEQFVGLGKKIGFEEGSREDNGGWFFIELKKRS
jgi:hypothetical protein